MSPLAFWRTVQAGLVELRDGHLSLQPSSPMVVALYQHPGRCLPFRVFLEQGRLFVGTVRLPTPGVREGREILEIAGLPAAVLLDSLSRFISRDGEVESRRQVVLERDFSLLLAMALDFPAEIALRFSHEDSASDSVRVTLVPYRKLAKLPPPSAQRLSECWAAEPRSPAVASFSPTARPVGKFFRDSFAHPPRGDPRPGDRRPAKRRRPRCARRSALRLRGDRFFRHVRRRWLRAAHF
jgi:hypothetical protein